MKQAKKLSLAAMAAVIGTSTFFGGVSASATITNHNTAGSKNVDVTYTNSDLIPDPTNPSNPEWGVLVPSGIAFTDSQPSANLHVELKPMKNGLVSNNPWDLKEELNVKVFVQSKNDFQLKYSLDETNTSVAKYYLNYGGTEYNNDNTQNSKVIEIGTLTKAAGGYNPDTDNTIITGTATLDSSVKPFNKGIFKDVLTYTIEKQK